MTLLAKKMTYFEYMKQAWAASQRIELARIIRPY